MWSTLTKIPNGRREVNEAYGVPDGTRTWERTHLTSITLPYALRYIEGKTVTEVPKIQVHVLAAGHFLGAFLDVWNYARRQIKERDGYELSSTHYDTEAKKWLAREEVDIFGGCYVFRVIRGGRGLSLHSYGVAIDFDPVGNEMGKTKGTLPAWFIAIWKKHGFKWGGEYKGRKDWMHFQLATGV